MPRLKPLQSNQQEAPSVIPVKKTTAAPPKRSIEDAPAVDIRNMLKNDTKPQPQQESVPEADDLPPLEDV